MNKLKKNNVVSFPSKLSDVDKEIEASISLSTSLNLDGNDTTLFFFNLFIRFF